MTTRRQEETLVSRLALRDAIRDDLLVALKAHEVTADPSFDGAPVLTIPELNKALDEVFTVALPPPDEKHGEVRTPATVVVYADCPECGVPVRTIVYLSAQLVVEVGTAEIKVKASSKARTHVHGQAELEEPPVDQMTVDDVLAGQSEDDAPTEGDGLTPDERLDRGLADGAAAPVCDYPGCARDPGHRGLHRDADGKRVSDVDIEPKGDES